MLTKLRESVQFNNQTIITAVLVTWKKEKTMHFDQHVQK